MNVCPCPCSNRDICEHIKRQIPPIHHPPTCHEANVCVIEDECPPSTPKDVVIYRNCYVPIRIVKKPTHPNVTPVNIHVRWREVHVLCDENGNPYPSEQAAELLKKMGNELADADAGAGAEGKPAEAAAEAPKKQWVWVKNEQVWGFGYPRPDGKWVIDQDSKRKDPPFPGMRVAGQPNPAPAAPVAPAPAQPVAAPTPAPAPVQPAAAPAPAAPAAGQPVAVNTVPVQGS